MMSSDVESILTKLGIRRSSARGQESVWTLTISDGSALSSQRSAYFDETHGTWKFFNTESSKLQVEKSVCSHEDLEDVGNVQALRASCQINSSSWVDRLPHSELGMLFRSTNWAATPLGPCSVWQYALRIYTHILFNDNRPATIYWGPHHIAIHNEHLLPHIGHLHPGLMGRGFEEAMPDLWNTFGLMFQTVETQGKGITRHGLEVPMIRHGHLEETYWDCRLTALVDDNVAHGGIYFSWIETTRTVVRERRTTLINQLGQSSLVDWVSIWQHIHDVLVDYSKDIPMAILYAVCTDELGDSHLRLGKSFGIGPHHTATIPILKINSSDHHSVLEPLFRRARDTPTGFLTLDVRKDEIHPSILTNVTWLGYGEPSRYILVACLRAGGVVKGYTLLGLSSRQELDLDHQRFVLDLYQQLNELMTQAAIAEKSRQSQQDLEKALTDSERRIDKLVQMAPVGIYELNADGSLAWANRHFFDTMGVADECRDPSLFSWPDYILPEDQEVASREMGRCLVEKEEISDSLRLKRRWQPPSTATDAQHQEEPYWILYSASPDLRLDGSVRALMGCLTNISHLKWSEQLQAHNVSAALRERRRQEEFIDVISHEMRNPLSVITQCADSILESLSNIKTVSSYQTLVEVIKQNVEAAESVSFCASHQKRIIDDVLALSKLDSGLLTIAPVPFCFDRIVDQTLQMFKAEFDASEITVRVMSDVETSVNREGIVHGDSARITQIIINLLTNAIKFTRNEATRTLMIRSGVSSTPPSPSLFGDSFRWQSTGKRPSQPKIESQPHQDLAVYPYFSVSDSGKGIAGDSTERVFCKFEQADQITHVNYGGSGLGLFICRELAEIQGGHIGIESQPEVGSTFAFYTKAERSYQQSTENGVAGPSKNSFPDLTDGPVSSKVTELSILLVEDNLLNQRVLARLLTKAGCTVCVANHGGEAIDFVLQIFGQAPEYASAVLKDAPGHFNCILMDWEMPVCNGIAATKRIRELEVRHRKSDHIIIGITANAREDQIATALEAGMDSVLSKPFRIQELLARMQDVMVQRDSAKVI